MSDTTSHDLRALALIDQALKDGFSADRVEQISHALRAADTTDQRESYVPLHAAPSYVPLHAAR
jgi:hypothetical protein